MSSYPKVIEKLIGQCGVGFNNAKNHSEIKEKISSFGYNDVKLDGLLDLNDQADKQYHEYERLSGEQLLATTLLEEKLHEEIGFYSTYRKLSFQVFPGEENKGIRSQLGIDQDIKRTFDGFVEQSKQLYDTTIKKSEIMTGFAEFAVTTETFQERLNGLEQLRVLNEEQEKAKGAAMVARKLRDDSYHELRTAWNKFKTVCRFLFKNNTEYLKILNIPVITRTRSKTAPDQGQTDPTDPTDPANQ